MGCQRNDGRGSRSTATVLRAIDSPGRKYGVEMVKEKVKVAFIDKRRWG